MVLAFRSATRVVSLVTLLVSAPFSQATAQPRDPTQYAHRAWHTRGLTIKYPIWAFEQTHDGYMWFGTQGGLYRFDGTRISPWNPPAGQKLPSPIVTTLKVTRDGTLWMGTLKGIVSWRDGQLTKHEYGAGGVSTQILEGADGTIRFGVSARKVCAIRGADVQCDGAGTLDAVPVGILEDHRGTLWVSTGRGLWRWAPGAPRRFTFPGAAPPSQMIEGDDGALVIAAGRLLWRMVGDVIQPFPVKGVGNSFTPSLETPDRIIFSEGLLRSRDGGIWMSTYQGILHLHHGQVTRFTTADGLSDNTVLRFFEDREGNVWTSTNEGLDRFRTVAARTISTIHGLASPTVWSVQADTNGDVWVGTAAGLNVVAGATKQVVTGKGLAGPVYALGLNREGQLLASTTAGLMHYRGGRFIALQGTASSPVVAIASDQDGTILMSTNDGHLLRWADGVLQRVALERPPQFGGDRVGSLLPDPSGGLWLGFHDWGLSHLVGAKVTPADRQASQFFGDITDLRLGSDGAIWASAQYGVARWKDGQAVFLLARNGLPCAESHWTIEDDDRALWIYTNCGLVRIESTEWLAWTKDPRRVLKMMVLGHDEGVRTRGFGSPIGPVVTKSTDGTVWFVVNNGVGFFDPRRLLLNEARPPVHIEKISADGRDFAATSAGGRVQLPPSIRNLEIDYTAPSFTAPEKVRFRFKLEGQDPDWREVVNQRRVAYSNLGPGPYRFRVLAANDGGAWNMEGAVFDFAVAPAYYQTTWFRSLSVGAFVALIWAMHGVRVRQLARREQRFRDALESMPAMAFTALPDGLSTFVNRRWVDYTGLSLRQATGSRWQDVVHPADLDRVLESWSEARTAGGPMEYEVRLRDAAGEYRWFLVRAAPLRDKRGQVARWYGVATDIQGRKHAEDERRRSDEALDRARSELAHVARVTTLGALTASIAHEVNQPLSGIITNASACLRMLAGDEPNIEGARETARRTIRDGNRASDVVTRLRALFARKETVVEPVDFNDAVREVIALSASAMQRNLVTVLPELADGLPRVPGDRVQLLQVVLNLLMNASDAMSDVHDRPRHVTIRTEPDGPGLVRLCVIDVGVGIEAQALGRLFEAFYTTKPSGMGIGLSVCRSIVERHGGRLWAEPNEGPGATFCLSLPCESRGRS